MEQNFYFFEKKKIEKKFNWEFDFESEEPISYRAFHECDG